MESTEQRRCAFPPFEEGGQGGFALACAEVKGKSSPALLLQRRELVPDFQAMDRTTGTRGAIHMSARAPGIARQAGHPAFPPFVKGGQGGFALACAEVKGKSSPTLLLQRRELVPDFQAMDRTIGTRGAIHMSALAPSIARQAGHPAFPPFEKGGQGGFAFACAEVKGKSSPPLLFQGRETGRTKGRRARGPGLRR
jgi:hypothetical protein